MKQKYPFFRKNTCRLFPCIIFILSCIVSCSKDDYDAPLLIINGTVQNEKGEGIPSVNLMYKMNNTEIYGSSKDVTNDSGNFTHTEAEAYPGNVYTIYAIPNTNDIYKLDSAQVSVNRDDVTDSDGKIRYGKITKEVVITLKEKKVE